MKTINRAEVMIAISNLEKLRDAKMLTDAESVLNRLYELYTSMPETITFR